MEERRALEVEIDGSKGKNRAGVTAGSKIALELHVVFSSIRFGRLAMRASFAGGHDLMQRIARLGGRKDQGGRWAFHGKNLSWKKRKAKRRLYSELERKDEMRGDLHL